eukprot:TRINITY_DN986_c0_g1_i2.p2 TRINITY_DN986_c0_g1~~TRINITY_DN986_c0_g1_i2.p2  ORF type:complete len:103 (-),score=22.34 TRINITY_DN986_c0_g1_i2:60-368(-)
MNRLGSLSRRAFVLVRRAESNKSNSTLSPPDAFFRWFGENASQVIPHAKAEFKEMNLKKWANVPGWTVSDAKKAGVVGLQCAGFFFLGEMIGKGSIIGYDLD